MTKHPLALFLLLWLCALTTSAQRTLWVADSLDRTPIAHVLITDATSGKLLSMTDKDGRATLPKAIARVGVSHLAYQGKLATARDTIWLSKAVRNVAEVVVASAPAEYYRLRSLVRTYQYVDSIPVNFVDAVVDFYVNAKGTQLDYKALRLDAYQNAEYIRQMHLRRGAVIESNNAIINWLLNPHLSTRNKALQIDASHAIRHKSGLEVGRLAPTDGGYVATIDLLLPSDTAVKTLFGRSVQLLSSSLEQTFPSSINVQQIAPTDMTSYRRVTRRNTWSKKHPTVVHLTEIQEITVLDRRRMAKKEVDAIKMDTEWTHRSHSLPTTDDAPTTPLPANIQQHIGKELQLLPYKE